MKEFMNLTKQDLERLGEAVLNKCQADDPEGEIFWASVALDSGFASVHGKCFAKFGERERDTNFVPTESVEIVVDDAWFEYDDELRDPVDIIIPNEAISKWEYALRDI